LGGDMEKVTGIKPVVTVSDTNVSPALPGDATGEKAVRGHRNAGAFGHDGCLVGRKKIDVSAIKGNGSRI